MSEESSRRVMTSTGLLILLVLSVMINYLERGILSVSAPLLRRDLSLTPEQMGLLFSAFFWSYSVCSLLVVVYGLTRGDWFRGFLSALTLAMAILPEELPVVLTVFLALGAWRMSRNRVLTRRVAAIEMLGAATALCVDKTGTPNHEPDVCNQAPCRR